MNTIELLKEWPQWKKAGAEVILASPAFAKTVDFQGRRCMLTTVPDMDDDTIDLRISFEGEECVLSLGDSALFPDLHLLWSKRKELPSALLLALIEKECGELLLFLENQGRRQVSVSGLAPDGTREKGRLAFRVDSVAFAMKLPVCLAAEWGKLENLDVEHPAIRSMTRNVVAEYADMELDEGDAESLAVGDCLLLDDDYMATARWRCIDDADKRLCICGKETIQISFGELADGVLPEIPAVEEAFLYRKNQVIAEGSFDRVGDRKCFKLTHLR